MVSSPHTSGARARSREHLPEIKRKHSLSNILLKIIRCHTLHDAQIKRTELRRRHCVLMVMGNRQSQTE